MSSHIFAGKYGAHGGGAPEADGQNVQERMPQGLTVQEDHHPWSRQHAEGATAGHGWSQQAGDEDFRYNVANVAGGRGKVLKPTTPPGGFHPKEILS